VKVFQPSDSEVDEEGAPEGSSRVAGGSERDEADGEASASCVIGQRRLLEWQGLRPMGLAVSQLGRRVVNGGLSLKPLRDSRSS
jgi:hypothetical protein